MTEKDERQDSGLEIPVQFGNEDIEPVKAEEEPLAGERPDSGEREGQREVDSVDPAPPEGVPETDVDQDPEITEMVNEGNISEQEADGVMPREQATQGEFIEDYEERIDELENRISELEAQLRVEREAKLRFAAEAENTRRRSQKDMEHTRFAIRSQLLQDFLPVLDHLEMAVAHANEDAEGAKAIVEGVKMVIKEFQMALEKHGVEVIDAVGQKFDPSVHEAVGQEERSDVEPGTVVSQWQKGYRIGSRLVRPARVVVSRAPAATQNDGTEGE